MTTSDALGFTGCISGLRLIQKLLRKPGVLNVLPGTRVT
jgi:hypothetical protein